MNQEHLNKLLHLFNEKAPIARLFGMKLSFTPQGQAVIDLPYNPNLDHALGAIHGGVYATLLDNAGWFTAAAARDTFCWVATAEMSIHFLRPVRHHSLQAVGRIIKCGKRQDIVESNLYDQDKTLVGHSVGTFIVLPNLPIA